MNQSGKAGRAIIFSISSDVGTALARRWLSRGWEVAGTYRTHSTALDALRDAGARLLRCDLSDLASVGEVCRTLCDQFSAWDALVLCPGMLEPVGSFEDCDFDAWEESLRVNLTGPLRVLHGVLPVRRRDSERGPCVLFFAGGGTNNAPLNYSAYTTSKIALVKACELLDAEIPDARFVVLGTGWVKTKIHEATLRAGERAGSNYQRTLEKLAGDDCTPMTRVLDFCDWALQAPREVVSGRNFSVPHDQWGMFELNEWLIGDPHAYKLRRSGNDRQPRPATEKMNMKHSRILDALLHTLPSIRDQHTPTSPLYLLLKQVARQEIENLFLSEAVAAHGFGPFGKLTFPYFNMGAVDSLSLFDLDELLLFSFYQQNRNRYRRVLDIGANVGLHSIILSRCEFEVRCFEPDPTHYRQLQRNLALNGCVKVTPVQAAVSNEAGTSEFVRVLGNTTGSHLAGSKPSPYGELERFPVRVEAIGPLLEWADLVKMDVEGHEAAILLSTQRQHWLATDGVVEIGSPANARAVYDHFRSLGVHLFAQKVGWGRVTDFAAMPTSYREGSLFITCKDEMPWESIAGAEMRKAS